MAGKESEKGDVVVYDAADLRRLLGIGRPNAYRLARLGRRIGRRLVVARAVLERWLASGGDSARDTLRKETTRRAGRSAGR